jgi:hypothetical protein
VEIAILALVFGPSVVVLLAGCVLALFRTALPDRRHAASSTERRRAY